MKMRSGTLPLRRLDTEIIENTTDNDAVVEDAIVEDTVVDSDAVASSDDADIDDLDIDADAVDAQAACRRTRSSDLRQRGRLHRPESCQPRGYHGLEADRQ